MTFTYDLTQLQANSSMQIRAMLRDTDEDAPLLQDEEIGLQLFLYPPQSATPPYYAAAACCDMISFNFAQSIQNAVGPISSSDQQMYDHYVALAQSLRVLGATNGRGVIPGSLAGVTPAGPSLGGGGKTYLGTTRYMDPDQVGE